RRWTAPTARAPPRPQGLRQSPSPLRCVWPGRSLLDAGRLLLDDGGEELLHVAVHLLEPLDGHPRLLQPLGNLPRLDIALDQFPVGLQARYQGFGSSDLFLHVDAKLDAVLLVALPLLDEVLIAHVGLRILPCLDQLVLDQLVDRIELLPDIAV